MVNTGEQYASTSGLPRDFWEAVYSLCYLAIYDIDLDAFVSDPWVVLAQVGQIDAPVSITNGYLPLLPRQAEVAKRMLEQELAAESASRVVRFERKTEH